MSLCRCSNHTWILWRTHSFPQFPRFPRTPRPSCHTSSEANRRGQLSGRYPKSSQKLLARSRRQVGPWGSAPTYPPHPLYWLSTGEHAWVNLSNLPSNVKSLSRSRMIMNDLDISFAAPRCCIINSPDGSGFLLYDHCRIGPKHWLGPQPGSGAPTAQQRCHPNVAPSAHQPSRSRPPNASRQR